VIVSTFLEREAREARKANVGFAALAPFAFNEG